MAIEMRNLCTNVVPNACALENQQWNKITKKQEEGNTIDWTWKKKWAWYKEVLLLLFDESSMIIFDYVCFLAWHSEGRTFAAHWVQQVLWFAARIALCNTWSSGGTALYRVGDATSQLDLPSLTPLSVAGWGRLQLGAPHWATSVNYCKSLIIEPTFCGSRFSTGRLLAIEDFTFTYSVLNVRHMTYDHNSSYLWLSDINTMSVMFDRRTIIIFLRDCVFDT